MRHIDKDCISGIQPGCGTNTNEHLHKKLNGILNKSRYGVELAYALITSSFYINYEEIASKRDKRTASMTSTESNVKLDFKTVKEQLEMK